MSKEKYVQVKIPKAMADDIKKRDWFRYYNDFQDFVEEAIREQLIRRRGLK